MKENVEVNIRNDQSYETHGKYSDSHDVIMKSSAYTSMNYKNEPEKSTLELPNDVKKFCRTSGSNFFSTTNKEEYKVPRVLNGYTGSMDTYSFLNIENQVLETFSGENQLVAFRMRDQNKEYGVLRYFELPNQDHKTTQIKAIKRVFYDDELNEEHHWVFVYLATKTELVWMIILCEDIINQTWNIGRIRIETLPLKSRNIQLEKDYVQYEEAMFEAVANIDSQLAFSQDPSINADSFQYAYEIKSELKSFNPFIPHPQNSSSAWFSRYPHSPRPEKFVQREAMNTNSSNLNSRMIDSYNSWGKHTKENRPSSMYGTNTEVNYGDLKEKLANDQSIESLGCATVNHELQKGMLSQSNIGSVEGSLSQMQINEEMSSINFRPAQKYFNGPVYQPKIHDSIMYYINQEQDQ